MKPSDYTWVASTDPTPRFHPEPRFTMPPLVRGMGHAYRCFLVPMGATIPVSPHRVYLDDGREVLLPRGPAETEDP